MKRGVAAILALSAACTPAPAPKKDFGPHPAFPIESGPHSGFACTSCHLPSQTNFNQFSCTTGCHDAQRNGGGHDDVPCFTPTSASCYACHPNARVPSLVGPVSDPSHDLSVVGDVPTFEGPLVSNVTPTPQTLPMQMQHCSAAIPTSGRVCTDCHVSASTGAFFPGQFHPSLDELMLTQPTACIDCHAASAPIGFVPTDGGHMRHEAVDAGVGDCSTCHVAPSSASNATWQTSAQFHTHVQPTTCLACHANERPGVVTTAFNTKFDHQGAVWLGDCVTCHTWQAGWAGGQFHASAGTPASCLPCHASERPPAGSDPRFDYSVNDAGIPHGDGQDCALCHSSTSQFAGGSYPHVAGPVATTCIVCHTSQWPGGTLVGPLNFNHADNGTGDCFGCHQNSTTGWDAGQSYPGDNLIASTDQFITVTTTTLKKTDGGFITGFVKTQTPIFNAMKHTSAAIPLAVSPDGGDLNTCWHCHQHAAGSAMITKFANGQFHTALDTYRLNPTDAPSTLPQPTTGCTDCHVNMRPAGIVGETDLGQMNHSGANATLECSVCHVNAAGQSWDAGVFHGSSGATPTDCVSCHFPLIADAGITVDVISTASQKPYAMKHRSPQVTNQQCTTCHTVSSHVTVTTSWSGGVLHANLSPAACIDCHKVSMPTDIRSSTVAYNGDHQLMNHQAPLVAATDCSVCHGADLAGIEWSASTSLHDHVHPTTCTVCHTGNAPQALIDTDTVSSAGGGLKDQIRHSDVNVTAHECSFCHTSLGNADGGTWEQASFHARFLGGNGVTGRCSNCHFNLKPSTADHAGLQETTGQDCSACHTWPGTGTVAAPTWQRAAAGPPMNITVGGFAVPMPPAADSMTVEPGLSALAHPAVPSGATCTTCHTSASGGRGAFAYDHALAPASGCASCHEAGSDLVGTPWKNNASGAVMVGATCGMGGGSILDRGGDTRPIDAAVPCSAGASTVNHFYPSDCSECHAKPVAVPATVQTSSAYAGNWAFKHYFGPPATNATCCNCHAKPSCRP